MSCNGNMRMHPSKGAISVKLADIDRYQHTFTRLLSQFQSFMLKAV